MTLEQISEQAALDGLDRFESIWLSGDIPDIARFLRQSKEFLPGWRCSLVELDLEYRWKRYHRHVGVSERDPFGFPQFPRLEDYANLLDEAERSQLLTPQLLAEEYRVRRFWGDRPSRETFLDRLPQQRRVIEDALNQIDTEFEIEGITPLEQELVEFEDAESTLLNHIQQPTSEIKSFHSNIGKYELVELLGRGGFGEVWRAYDPHLKRHVALKFPRPDKKFPPEWMDVFRREAQKMAALEQVPGVVPVYESGESNGVPYIVSFLVEGHNLGARLKDGSLTLEDSVRIVAEVATTLHRAHLNNLFHRDVKLSNVLVNREGRAFLSDFGLSVSEEEQLRETHSATGTYAYMSPEQIRAQSHRVDGRADIYSLGVVLYRLLTKRLPYVAETPADYIDQVLHREPRPLRSIDDRIPAELERICLKCLSKPISHRYTTAGDLADELRAWLADAGSSRHQEEIDKAATGPSTRQDSAKFLSRTGIFAVFCLLLGGLGVSYFWPSNPPPVDTSGGTVDQSDDGEEAYLYLTKADPVVDFTGLWQVHEGENAVALSTTGGVALKTLDRFEEGKSLRFEFDLEELATGSSLGVFFGMNQPEVNFRDVQLQLLLIKSQGRGSYQVALEWHEYDAVNHSIKGVGKREFITTEKPLSVDMSISAKGIESLEIQDQKFPDLISEYQQRTPAGVSGAGRFGLAGRNGSGVFSNPVINQTARQFKER